MKVTTYLQKVDLTVFAPGRINLLGEHTDYNQGYVLPAAIQQGLRVHLAKRSDNQCRLYSAALGKEVSTSLEQVSRSSSTWENYFLGVLSALVRRANGIGGFDAYLEGELPPGAGMSSSAAVECSIALGINELFQLGLSRRVLVEVAGEADREFVGVKSGAMDPYAALFGKKDHFILLDCRSLTHEYIPVSPGPYKLVLLNSGVSHELASGEYNRRQETCEKGVAIIQKEFPGVRSLRDVSSTELEYLAHHANETITARCRYVVEENERVISAADALRSQHWEKLGKLMYKTHEGLSKLYEVSCPEIDFLVSRARLHQGVLGARLMGGGFGGCTLNLVHEDGVEEFIADCTHAYAEFYSRDLEFYHVAPSEGARTLS